LVVGEDDDDDEGGGARDETAAEARASGSLFVRAV
jgi:hypothetical protein